MQRHSQARGYINKRFRQTVLQSLVTIVSRYLFFLSKPLRMKYSDT